MALYQPTNIFPSSFAGVGGGVVDVTQPLTVSWQVNGSSAMTDYQIAIYENTTASALVYNSNKTAVNPPFFGVTSTGEVQYFTLEIPASALSGLSNGFSSGYKMLITQWWNGGSVQQLSPSFFVTRANPTISINGLPSTVTTRSITLTADYTQAQGDTLDWFRWMLATPGNERNPIEDSGFIYGTEDIQVSYDGLFTQTDYVVRCMVQTEFGAQADTGWKPFRVEYEVSTMDGYVDACLSPVEGISVQWPKISFIPGEADGSYTIEDGQLILPPGSSITWDERNGEEMNIPGPWTLAWSGQIPVTGNNRIWEITGEGKTLTFGITPSAITLTLDGTILATREIDQIVANQTIRMVLTPRQIHVYYNSVEGGLFPATNLYPSPFLYPDGGVSKWNTWTYALTWVQPPIQSITLYGQQICDFITVIAREVSGSRLDGLLTDFSTEPTWDLDTWFQAGFEGTGINGGNITPVGDTIKGAVIYRLRSGEQKLVKIAEVDVGTSSIMDEGFRNQNEYTYYVFILGETTFVSAPLVSNVVTPNFWNWTILECSQDDYGIYHMESAHIFANNVSTDSISNNNSPQLLQNFTPYPIRQPTSYNYKSSVLTGYIGKVDMKANRYIDTVDMAEKIWNLSVSTLAKFLRDRKGNFWRVESNAAITMQTGDTLIPQPYQGTFSWCETGTTDGVSVICEPGDGAWDEVTGQPPEETGVTKIVVTSSFGSTVTISNGTYSFVERCYGFVTYLPPVDGLWTVSAVLGDGYDSKEINITTVDTYYVGLYPTPFTATLFVDAPGGTQVTVTNGEIVLRKEVPQT